MAKDDKHLVRVLAIPQSCRVNGVAGGAVRLRFDWLAAEAVRVVVVDDAAGLHPGIDDDRADELEAAFLERRGDLFGERRLCGNRTAILNWLVAQQSHPVLTK